ncbi:ISAon1 family transposase [Elizabethkingia anophelis]|uniref:ISAon1 family transposase n=1 Tax=Elizabethkingia anophelis TaxID=1117645 RepID=UPI00099A4F5A|nr:transposase [Elizabethkingia anophelis]OPC30673.1 transposase [Elizabethkingia anophelis]
MYGVNGRKFQRQYKHSISDFRNWEQKPHAENWVLYPQKLSEQLSLDEVALSDGELYTIVTSKKAKGRKGSIVAIIQGTQSNTVIECLLKISRKARMKVREVTLDMAGSMKRIAKRCFPCASLVIDRFHVQKLAIEALQEIRIKHRWEAIEMENNTIEKDSKEKTSLEIESFENGDSRKQLLARSRYLLYKSREKWTLSQKQRASILFAQYPDLEKAYQLTDELRKIYSLYITKSMAMTKLAHWFRKVEEADFKSFSTLRKTIMQHYRDILNYFDKRSTNAAAESFNAKIKNFRMQLRGVKDRTFFIFRLTKLFA